MKMRVKSKAELLKIFEEDGAILANYTKEGEYVFLEDMFNACEMVLEFTSNSKYEPYQYEDTSVENYLWKKEWLEEITENEVETKSSELSYRGQEWVDFSNKILNHIETYTVPQYGDYPNDQACSWSAKDCVLAIAKYSARFGQNSRPRQEELDLMKIAHYACLGSSKLSDKVEEMVTITLKEYNKLLTYKEE